MQKAFVFILFMWNSSSSISHDDEYLFLLGCKAVIPCHNYARCPGSVKWVYKREAHDKEKTLLFVNNGGVTSYGDVPRHQVTLGDKRSLIINPFTADFEGLYLCVPSNCNQYNCKISRTILVQKEVLSEAFETVPVSAGDTFAYECPTQFNNTRWTFQARNKSSFRNLPGPQVVNSNRSLYIANVKTKDAGIYTCSVRKCDRHFVKLLTLTLCVTEHQFKNLSDSCPDCELSFNNTEPHNVTNEHSCESLNCISDQTSCEHGMTITYATLGAFMCLIFMILTSWCLRFKLQAASRCCPSYFGIDSTVEEEAPAVYSSIIIRNPELMKNNHIPTCTEATCVYSELKVNDVS